MAYGPSVIPVSKQDIAHVAGTPVGGAMAAKFSVWADQARKFAHHAPAQHAPALSHAPTPR